jgi:uncharacterized integral membrane protein
MRLFKLVITLIIVCLVAVFIYQNLGVWDQRTTLGLNLYLVQKSLPVRVPVLLLISLLLGFFAGLTVLLKFHVKTRRQLKRELKEKKQMQANPQPASSSIPNAPGAGTGGEV